MYLILWRCAQHAASPLDYLSFSLIYILGCMCSTDPFHFRRLKGYIHSFCHYHHQIGSINLTHYHIFFVVVWLRCLLHHILIVIAYTFRENRDFVFIIIVRFMMRANSRIRFGLTDRVRLFVPYTISLSSLCKLIWRHWLYKLPVRYVLSSVWVGLSMFSQLSTLQYMALYVFVCPFPLRWLG